MGELRLKWQKKDFAKDALFESLFPDLKKYSGKDGSDADGGWWEIWLMLGIMVFIIFCGGFALHGKGGVCSRALRHQHQQHNRAHLFPSQQFQQCKHCWSCRALMPFLARLPETKS